MARTPQLMASSTRAGRLMRTSDWRRLAGNASLLHHWRACPDISLHPSAPHALLRCAAAAASLHIQPGPLAARACLSTDTAVYPNAAGSAAAATSTHAADIINAGVSAAAAERADTARSARAAHAAGAGDSANGTNGAGASGRAASAGAAAAAQPRPAGDQNSRDHDSVSITYRGRVVRARRGALLRTALLRGGCSPHSAAAQVINCRGLGTCGTCAVQIASGAVGPPEWTAMERARLNFPPHKAPGNAKLRLACQVTCASDVEVLKFDKFWGEGDVLVGEATPGEFSAPFGELEFLLDGESDKAV